MYEIFHRASVDFEAEAETQALEMDAVAGQHFHVRVVDKTDAIQVDHSQVGRVRLDFADVDHFVDLFLFFVCQLESACTA